MTATWRRRRHGTHDLRSENKQASPVKQRSFTEDDALYFPKERFALLENAFHETQLFSGH